MDTLSASRSNLFFEQTANDLAAYADHAGRKTIDESDVECLMQRYTCVEIPMQRGCHFEYHVDSTNTHFLCTPFCSLHLQHIDCESPMTRSMSSLCCNGTFLANCVIWCSTRLTFVRCAGVKDKNPISCLMVSTLSIQIVRCFCYDF